MSFHFFSHFLHLYILPGPRGYKSKRRCSSTSTTGTNYLRMRNHVARNRKGNDTIAEITFPVSYLNCEGITYKSNLDYLRK